RMMRMMSRRWGHKIIRIATHLRRHHATSIMRWHHAWLLLLLRPTVHHHIIRFVTVHAHHFIRRHALHWRWRATTTKMIWPEVWIKLARLLFIHVMRGRWWWLHVSAWICAHHMRGRRLHVRVVRRHVRIHHHAWL